MTMTDSRFISKRLSSAITLMGPAISTSRRGLRSSTFTGARLRPRSQVADHDRLARAQLESRHLHAPLHHSLHEPSADQRGPDDEPPLVASEEAPARRPQPEQVHPPP